MRKLTILFLFFHAIQSYGQDLVLIKGYVIGNDQILPEISVSVLNKRNETKTNFKGRFKIQCSIGDTLVFEKKYSDDYKIEKYLVKDSSMLIVKLIHEVKLDNHGRPFVYGSSYKSSIKHLLQFSSSFIDKNVFNIGYSYYSEPIFPDKPYMPIRNSVSFGMNISSYDNNYYLFPNIGIDLRSNYEIGRSNISFFIPMVKIGYWFNDFKPGKNGFGYELGVNLIRFSINHFNLFLAGTYNNYLTPDGTFMLSLNFCSFSKDNQIPKFIQKKILK